MKPIIALAIFAIFFNTVTVARPFDHKKLTSLVRKSVDNKYVFGATVCISNKDETLTMSAGNLADNSPYFIASTTKLYVSATILKMRSEGLLNLDDKIAMYLDPATMKGLHIYKSVDYSDRITIRQLLSQTSGLPDYFQQKGKNGISVFDELKNGRDRKWTFEEAVALTKEMKPHFRPGQKGKAFYSDINYQLLGRIIENRKRKKLDDVFAEYIYSPLNLTHSYLYASAVDSVPAQMYFNHSQLKIPLAMTSVWADGGIVTDNTEGMLFLKAYMNGALFPKEYLAEIQSWNKIFYPLQYGTGIMKFEMSPLFTGFRKLPVIIGHSGISGAFQYYCPEKDVFVVGTINQINKPSLSYRLLVKLLLAI